MCQIINLEDYRPIPSINRQRDVRESFVSQEIQRLYVNEPYPLVAKAIDAAKRSIQSDMSFEEAMMTAKWVMVFSKRAGRNNDFSKG